ncbi:nucleotidyltransferase family protein [Ignisphaera sp. 4213-co]|uniref:Nucleotidyltransferase family protein n=1 Tax=Ignisphaera cupida TaxID=3050454 RepID=A0ABD4Z4E7_9CREN|nr:nucleotidyltransferase family protein [Ignisphaera sp. 4213-co]MDK6027999.1 nucleotidyltransferase family protein [Ignisphaera sp. 4213-co]
MYSNKLENVVASILAGGEGTRFKPYTEIIPKPMIPIGCEEKPLLEHIVCWLKKFGVTKFVFLVGYRWRQIRNYFGDGSRYGVSISYSLDDEEYHNTGGALLKAFKSNLFENNTIIVWYGDIIAPINVSNLIMFHRNGKADATVVLADKYQVPVGVAKIDNLNNVVELVEKPWLNFYVSIGVLVMEPYILKNVENYLGKSFDIMSDLVPWLIRKGFSVKAYIYNDFWYDVGSLERYVKLDYNVIKKFLCE